ncbi:carbohydrate ABC transporter permease [Geotoga petraea]|jgi:glucose/mannose transport system permease protein|uniref:Carbohydrate ABC transporter membrane protein 1, CUT1 family n=1 Tax=Geotoga petraea TaxID=28234 RepID=A0A1G6KS44_9BACT|nr:sugar ABC transporter permease [Geotoga petraea]MDK2946250.1 glucose/mannose transport system permease protein [Geotoga sp.]TGG88697.1 sugar ABC transporter permease [Geotoga petraea]SDC33345.1 carbohydrate ABC transporter membrane protein 1, CUT1 family [Geotoga petraea]
MSVHKKKSRLGFTIILPSLILIGIFVYYFIFLTLRTSVSNWNSFSSLAMGEYKFVGLRNFQRLFMDPRFQSDLWNTLFFTAFFIIACITIGLFLANILDKGLKGSKLFQNIFLFPMAISFVVTGTVMSWIFAPGRIPGSPQGLNILFEKLGLDFLQWQWYTSTESVMNFNLALIPVILAAVWQFSGYIMAMYLAGMRAIPNDIIEASKVDGASDAKIFWKIKMPLLQPITLSAMIVLGHISLKIFDLIYAMTGSGPNNVTDMPAVYMFELTFRSNRYAMGSAISIIMLLFVAVVIIPYLWSSFRKGSEA